MDMHHYNAVIAPSFRRMCLALALAVAASACDDGDSDEDDDDGVGDTADEGAAVPDPDCDALLTPEDFSTVCGAALTLEPTGFEGIELNPCNRTAANDEAILLVTRHPDADTAMSAADVAGGRGPTLQAGLGLHASAGSRSVFMIEVKAADRADAVCSPEALPTLLDLALDRVVD